MKEYLKGGIFTGLEDYDHLQQSIFYLFLFLFLLPLKIFKEERCKHCFSNGKNCCGLILNFVKGNSTQYNSSTLKGSKLKGSTVSTSSFKHLQDDPDLKLTLKVYRKTLLRSFEEVNH